MYQSVFCWIYLAKATEDALCVVNVVANRTTAAVGSWLGFDRNRLRRANRFTQLARNASFLACARGERRKTLFAARCREFKPKIFSHATRSLVYQKDIDAMRVRHGIAD
jgi:hypothetical protein